MMASLSLGLSRYSQRICASLGNPTTSFRQFNGSALCQSSLLSSRQGTSGQEQGNRKTLLHPKPHLPQSRDISKTPETASTPAAAPAPPDGAPSWYSRLIGVGGLEATRESHSKLLAEHKTVYELQTHNVKPESLLTYLDLYEEFTTLMSQRHNGLRLVGSFLVEVGDQDQVIHIWEFPDGWDSVQQKYELYRKDEGLKELRKQRSQLLRSRQSQLCLKFSFWPPPTPREKSHIYELRSYTLKPGTILEWGNHWARGIHYRNQDNCAAAGFFSQVGQLYNVNHLWAYKDLQTRREMRESAWQRPGWNETVTYTVPLIRHMESKLMVPTSFSPMQ